MALILKTLYTYYKYVFEEEADHRSNDWLMGSSPIGALLIVAAYLYFVQVFGPKWMKNRKPYNIDRFVQFYDVIQIIMSLYIVKLGLEAGWGTTYKWICEPVDYTNSNSGLAMVNAIYVYWLCKVCDLLDTVFFILRKKEKQVTFLHTYHHAIMIGFVWIAFKFAPGGHGTFIGIVNAFVHAVMYSYYLITSIYPNNKKAIWCKKYITQMQIFQFCLVGLHAATVLFLTDCAYQEKWITFIIVPQNVFMGLMFYDFYKRAYLKKNISKPNVSE